MDEEIETSEGEKLAIDYVENYQAVIECLNCNYKGLMPGFLRPDQPKFIMFVCPECNAIERVKNVFGI